MVENQKKLVVMQILPSLQNGGVERGTIDVAIALKKDGFEPIVVSSGGIMVYQLREAGIRHIDAPVNVKNPFKIRKNIDLIVDLIEQNKVDIVHVRSRAPMWSAYFACKKTKTKLVTTVHGTYSLNFLWWKNFPIKRAYNAIMLRADAIIAVSNFIKAYLFKNYRKKDEKFPLQNFFVVQRGVDLKYFDSSKVSKNHIIDLIKKWNLPEDKKIILMPARFTAWKGHEFLIDALEKVQQDFCCVMVGSDHGHKKFRKKLEQQIVEKNLAEKVRIVGVCREMSVAYALSNFVVCPSVKPEAFGRVAIEAQSSSRVIIATRIGGSLETIIDGKTGFLVSVGDSLHFSELIEKALAMPKSELDEMGRAGRKNVEENFSNEKMCKETIDIYRSVLF